MCSNTASWGMFGEIGISFKNTQKSRKKCQIYKYKKKLLKTKKL